MAKTVLIGKEDLCQEFYHCLKCGCNDITKSMIHCPSCGEKIEW